MIRFVFAAGLGIASTIVAANAEPLKPGLYVDATVPCEDPPSVAILGYDGEAFVYKTQRCLMKELQPDGKVRVVCSEADPASETVIFWQFKQLSATSFEVDGSTLRQCPATP